MFEWLEYHVTGVGKICRKYERLCCLFFFHSFGIFKLFLELLLLDAEHSRLKVFDLIICQMATQKILWIMKQHNANQGKVEQKKLFSVWIKQQSLSLVHFLEMLMPYSKQLQWLQQWIITESQTIWFDHAVVWINVFWNQLHFIFAIIKSFNYKCWYTFQFSGLFNLG